MSQTIRIGNAQAFWGDRTAAAMEMLTREPELDFLTLDYLAEVSMSILAYQRQRDPQAGYARDFVDLVKSLVPYWSAGGRCRLIANAGGLNPIGCAEACRRVLEAAGCPPLRIGIVSGDDVLDLVRSAALENQSNEFRNLENGESLGEAATRLVTANAYLGARPIVNALAERAEIVITGRVADPSLVVAACQHDFGWTDAEFDRLAGATVAGHLIECGTQVTGGISTDWLNVPDPAHIGFPIVEVSDDGSCVVTKPNGSGGCVTPWTVKEQLVYEIGDPANYLSPDVTVSFSSLRVEAIGLDRVRVSGALGKPPPPQYKVSATVHDGYRAAGTLLIVGRDATEKATRCGELVLQRVREAGHDLRERVIECLGSPGNCIGMPHSAPPVDRASFHEVVLRVAVESESRDAVECFTREMMPLITAGPQGTTGYAEGRPRIHPVIRYWPCLIDRNAILPKVETMGTTETTPRSTSMAGSNVIETQGIIEECATPDMLPPDQFSSSIGTAVKADNGPLASQLHDIALARSGDKGTSANLGVLARSPDDWDFLKQWLTAERVWEFLKPRGCDTVERFELDNLQALNFVVRGILRQPLRSDAQGKALGQMLLEMPLPADQKRRITRREDRGK